MLSRRGLLWLIPASFAGGVAMVAARHLSWRYDTLPDVLVEGEDVSIVEFADDGARLGMKNRPRLSHSDEYWLAHLTPPQYYVTRRQATDPPYTGTYHRLHQRGLYRCVCCATALFSSDAKYDSGTGWPSFWAPIAKENIARVNEPGATLYTGIEVRCRLCDA